MISENKLILSFSSVDPKRHMPGTYTTDCESMRASASSVSRKHLFSNPVCQPDGMFHRIQISGARQVCVDPSGSEISDYGADVDSPEAKVMNCSEYPLHFYFY